MRELGNRYSAEGFQWCAVRHEPSADGLTGLNAGAHFDHAARSYSVAEPGHAFGRGAMLAAEKCAFLFEPMADDMNTTISAGRSKRMDRALKAIESVGPAVHDYLKRLVVVISARFAFGHDCLPLTWAILQTYNPPHPASLSKAEA